MGDSTTIQHIGVAAIVVYTLQLLKKVPWFPWVSGHSDKLNRVISVVVAFFAAVGIKLAMTGSWIDGGQILITYPSLDAMVSTGIHFVAQFAIQESLYQSTVKPPQPSVQVVDKLQVVNVGNQKSND